MGKIKAEDLYWNDYINRIYDAGRVNWSILRAPMDLTKLLNKNIYYEKIVFRR
jgi:hypothetical protein